MDGYLRLLASRLPVGRYGHSLRVAEMAARLAVNNRVNPQQAHLAGLLHDYARDLRPAELLRLATRANLVGCELEKRMPVLLHGPVGALLIQRELGITDKYICQAVARHTVGGPDMGILDKIVYLADYIELGRNYKGIQEIRHLAWADLELALLKAFEASISYVIAKGKPLHPATVEARNHILFIRGVVN